MSPIEETPEPVAEEKAGWDAFFADEAMVLPEDFDTGDDPLPQDQDPF